MSYRMNYCWGNQQANTVRVCCYEFKICHETRLRKVEGIEVTNQLSKAFWSFKPLDILKILEVRKWQCNSFLKCLEKRLQEQEQLGRVHLYKECVSSYWRAKEGWDKTNKAGFCHRFTHTTQFYSPVSGVKLHYKKKYSFCYTPDFTTFKIHHNIVFHKQFP